MSVAVGSDAGPVLFEATYLPFLRRGLRGELHWRVRPGPVPREFSLLSGGERWSWAVRDGRPLVLVRRGGRRRSVWKAASLSPDGKTAEIWIARPGRGRASPPLFFLDLLLFACALARRRGAIVHAAAVKRGGGVFLFPGPEGCGKSTWSALAGAVPGCEVLGEDKVIVRAREGGFCVYGSPWNPRAEYRSPAGGALRGICFLSPARSNRLRPLPPGEARRRALAAFFLPFASSAELLAASSLAADLVAAVPVLSFSFRDDVSAAEYFFEAARRSGPSAPLAESGKTGRA